MSHARTDLGPLQPPGEDADSLARSSMWDSRFAERTRGMRRSTVRELLKVTSRPGIISFAGGLPAAELFPMDAVRAAMEVVWTRSGRRALQYGETEGVIELREWVAAHLRRPGLRLTPENVIITTGGQQALDLVGRVLINAGDRVAVENPTYLAALSAWRPWGASFVGIPGDAEGMRLGDRAGRVRGRTKLLYTIPNFQNPQGTSLSLGRRQEVVQRCREAGVAVVEDDPYGELRDAAVALPSLLELDATAGRDRNDPGNVIHCGTFSKTLAPGLRVGWVAAPSAVIERLVLAKQAADLHTSTLSQWLALELVRAGVLETHLPLLRDEYRRRRQVMLEALERHFPEGTGWTRPAGGMFLMVTLPRAVDAGRLLVNALARGVAFVPGAPFHLGGRGRNTLRLNFSNAPAERIEQGIRILAGIVREDPGADGSACGSRPHRLTNRRTAEESAKTLA